MNNIESTGGKSLISATPCQPWECNRPPVPSGVYPTADDVASRMIDTSAIL